MRLKESMIKLLVVDDDIATLEVIRDLIDWEKLNINQVYTALNVTTAKQIINENVIDIVISDIEMPKESGIDLIKWVREEKKECEFIFLTCHEKFTYATDAISYNAAAYVTKPFDLGKMELTLQKVIAKICQSRELKRVSEYGHWMVKNHRVMKINFWKSILEGELVNKERIKKEIRDRHLDIVLQQNYYMVSTKLSNIERDIDKYGKDVFEFVLEGFHSELLSGNIMNESTVKYYTEGSLIFVTICKDGDSLKEKCERLIETCKNHFVCTMTCCIGSPCDISNLSKKRTKLMKLFYYNVSSFGKVFNEEEVETISDNNFQIIDLDQFVKLIEKRDKAYALNYLKKLINELTACKKLNAHTLFLMKQEIIQVVYTDLMKFGIQATKLFYDECSKQMEERALESTVDMLRWVNYLLEKTFRYEDEVSKNATVVDKINEYIHNHYAENIGRTRIAAEFFLTPEYLAKLYKKKTGINLKDYINEYRIEKAKELLMVSDTSISDVAEAVGFDNFSYFSTIFKKITGSTPKEYKLNKRQLH